MTYAQKLIYNNETRIVIIDYNGKIKQNTAFKESIRAMEQTAPNHIALYDKNKINQKFLEQIDLTLLSINAWKEFVEIEPDWFSSVPSVLILKG